MPWHRILIKSMAGYSAQSKNNARVLKCPFRRPKTRAYPARPGCPIRTKRLTHLVQPAAFDDLKIVIQECNDFAMCMPSREVV